MRYASAWLLGFVLLALPAAAQNSEACHSPGLLLEQVQASLSKGGLRAITPQQAQAMEQSLAAASACFPSLTNADGSVTMLADGAAETLLASGSMVDRKVSSTVVLNPFPRLALFLGSYYNEIGNPQDALRILDKGLSLSPFPESRLGANIHWLISEKGAAFNALKRFDEGLKSYEEGLQIASLAATDQARMHRGRGFSLTELGRLEEAENAYRESLKLAPGNTTALHELAYLARLRNGADKTGGYLTTQAPASADKDVPEEQRAKQPGGAN
jgi:tetratricopeptide (TPR) repeat protein